MFVNNRITGTTYCTATYNILHGRRSVWGASRPMSAGISSRSAGGQSDPKIKIHSSSTHLFGDGGVHEVFKFKKHFWSFRGKQRSSQNSNATEVTGDRFFKRKKNNMKIPSSCSCGVNPSFCTPRLSNST